MLTYLKEKPQSWEMDYTKEHKKEKENRKGTSGAEKYNNEIENSLDMLNSTLNIAEEKSVSWKCNYPEWSRVGGKGWKTWTGNSWTIGVRKRYIAYMDKKLEKLLITLQIKKIQENVFVEF